MFFQCLCNWAVHQRQETLCVSSEVLRLSHTLEWGGGSIWQAKQNDFHQRLDCSLATSDCDSNAKLVCRAGSWNAKRWGKEGRNKMLLLACCVTVYWEVLFLPTFGNSWFWSLHENPADCEPCLPSCWQGWNTVLQWSWSGKTVQMKGDFLERLCKGCSDKEGCWLAYKSSLIIKCICLSIYICICVCVYMYVNVCI